MRPEAAAALRARRAAALGPRVVKLQAAARGQIARQRRDAKAALAC